MPLLRGRVGHGRRRPARNPSGGRRCGAGGGSGGGRVAGPVPSRLALLLALLACLGEMHHCSKHAGPKRPAPGPPQRSQRAAAHPPCLLPARGADSPAPLTANAMSPAAARGAAQTCTSPLDNTAGLTAAASTEAATIMSAVDTAAAAIFKAPSDTGCTPYVASVSARLCTSPATSVAMCAAVLPALPPQHARSLQRPDAPRPLLHCPCCASSRPAPPATSAQVCDGAQRGPEHQRNLWQQRHHLLRLRDTRGEPYACAPRVFRIWRRHFFWLGIPVRLPRRGCVAERLWARLLATSMPV